ncbi:LysR family transcriptional regulator [Vibrio sp. SCSIO 43136]|uniref:LysR family transcriptional regulator n=1 Tax=Vibrio sp. SCSIO 43136 TaxID=2819101 RepID=UPI002075C6B0|nr:LysR family transcriptional regulator [Vibrio sp. SCSIO 43136]USD64728.1 LysR family transcriptional regulator [Vibrio sp. SCSIO 43136]
MAAFDRSWKSVDLNLMVSFIALYETQSVTEAAQRMFVSQSAMSHSLAKLRNLLGDPLFERRGHKMLPTERATQLAPIAKQILTQIENNFLTHQHFEPEHYQGVCRIGLTDYAEFIFGPKIFDSITEQAPQCQIAFINVNRTNYVIRAESDKLDVIIGSFSDLDSKFQYHHLYTEQHVCLFDPNRISVKTPLSLDDYLRYPHALVSPNGQLSSPVDKILEEQGHTRQARVAAGNFLTVGRLLADRAMLAVVPSRMAKLVDYNSQLENCLPPIEVPDFDISLVWSKHADSNEKNLWLRKTIMQCCR